MQNYGHIVVEHWPDLLGGVWTTIWLVGSSLFIGLFIAIPFGVILASKPRTWWHFVIKTFVQGFSYIFRGTPMLVQLYIIYYGIGLQLGAIEGIRDSALWSILRQPWPWALLSFVLNTAAYTCEIIRGAIETTPKGEVEAAFAMGMTKLQVFRSIVAPGAVQRALPAYGNEVIFMLHGSAIASVVTIMDISGVARHLASKYYEPFMPYISAAILYLIITSVSVIAFRILERRFSRHL